MQIVENLRDMSQLGTATKYAEGGQNEIRYHQREGEGQAAKPPPMSNDSGIVIITSVRWISEYAARNSVSIVIIGKREQNGVLEFV